MKLKYNVYTRNFDGGGWNFLSAEEAKHALEAKVIALRLIGWGHQPRQDYVKCVHDFESQFQRLVLAIPHPDCLPKIGRLEDIE